MRRLKKSRGEQVGRPAKKGVAGYNRFAASSAPRSAQTPKSYIAGAEETTKSVSPYHQQNEGIGVCTAMYGNTVAEGIGIQA